MLRPPPELPQRINSHSREGKEQTSYRSRNEDEQGDQRTSRIDEASHWQDDWIAPLPKGICALPSPPGIAARLPQVVFEVTQRLPQLVQLLFLSVDFRLLLLDIAARVLLRHRLLRVRVVFYLGLFQLAPQNIEFFFRLFSGLGGLSGLGRAPRRLPRCSSRRPRCIYWG